MTLPSSASTLTQGQLESTLWAAANALRGPVDPGDFKAYVFPILFFKWISDNWDWQHGQAIADWGDDLTDEIEYSDYQPFVVPDGCHWADVHGTKKNLGAKVNDALQRIEMANPKTLKAVFGDVNWANTDRLPEPALAALLDAFHSVVLTPAHLRGDMLGAAYEYLLREFAEASGKKAGEFFTPRHVVHLLVKILDPKPGESILDPACGSGGMLVETAQAVEQAGGNPRSLSLHGQEVNLTTSAIARMNLFLHGLEDFEVKRGDTFRQPGFVESGKLRQFDIVIANPPFSLKNWGAESWAKDRYKRAFCGVPPAKNGDYAWLQHMIASMTPITGRVGVVMPHGVLFRKDEAAIRRCLLEKDLLEAVIGLPNKLFYSTSIPVCLLIFRAEKSVDRRNKVLFIDGSSRFKPAVNQNIMTDYDIEVVHGAYAKGVDLDGEDGLALRLVDLSEIADNGHDLNVGRYIQTSTAADVDVAMAINAYLELRDALRTAEDALDLKLKAAGFSA